MTYQEFDAMVEKLKTVNRRLGQLYRNILWNYDLIVSLEEQRSKLENEIKFYAPIIEQRVKDIRNLLW